MTDWVMERRGVAAGSWPGEAGVSSFYIFNLNENI